MEKKLNGVASKKLQTHTRFYFNYIIYYGLLIFYCQNVATHFKEIADKIGESKCSSCEIKDLIYGEKIEWCSIDTLTN